MDEKKNKLKFDDQRLVEQVTWQMRLADMPRAENRTVLNRTFNGDPPFDEATAEENNIEVNRNFLEGTGNLTDARTQWNANFLKPGDLFSIKLDSGPVHKRQEYSMSITKNLMRVLKKSLGMVTQSRGTGAGVLLHGVGPTTWQDRYAPVPAVLPMGSLMVPSETEIDFENLEYFAIFREMTPAQLYDKTHGPKVDPGWNMQLVNKELKFVGDQTQKQPNATAFQFMPERIEELIKQDMGFWGSDAVPTIDYWDFYFRQRENGTGWYRRIFLDWSSSGRGVEMTRSSGQPASPNEGEWLYTSGDRKYADSWQEIFHCNFGDCSCVAPFKYHSVRSLGWMIWGLCDIQNRLRCKITEQAFSDLMWFFRTASQSDFTRIKKANFLQMGIIPQGIDWVKANDRYSPNPSFIQLVIGENQRLMTQHSAAFTRTPDKSGMDKEKTATQVMAEVNSINTLVSGVMNMAYTYEKFKYDEICRRFTVKGSRHPMVEKFVKACRRDNVPPEFLDAERWEIEPERALGAGNKTVQMAIVQYLQSIRQNLGPEAQRKVDHIGIQVMTEDVAVAEDLAPIKDLQVASESTQDAERVTERLMRGLPMTPLPKMVYEDYVKVWLRDMAMIVQRIQQTNNVGTIDDIIGLQNMGAHIAKFLQQMGSNPADREKVRKYSDALNQIGNVVKAFQQRLQEQMQASGENIAQQANAETAAKLRGKMMIDQAKAANLRESHAQKTAQRQVQFELEEQRKDRQLAAEERRKAQAAMRDVAMAETERQQQLNTDVAATAQELAHNELYAKQERELAKAAEEEKPSTTQE